MKLAIGAACLSFALAAAAAPLGPHNDLAADLANAAPGINPDVVVMAVESMACASRVRGGDQPRRLVVIDYSKPSAEQRLWVFDLQTRELLFLERVAHGRGSGENVATQFSNLSGSRQSSLGLFRTGETYVGENGYSLRLDGLAPGFNDRARARAIVIHGASYVSDEMISRRGGVGRSWGCPAVRTQIARTLIDAIKDGQYLFAYYPESQWLQHSALRSCAQGLNNVRQAIHSPVQPGATALVQVMSSAERISSPHGTAHVSRPATSKAESPINVASVSR